MSFWKDRNVFITGSTGFLGYWVTDELIKRGANVVALVRDWVPKAPFCLNNMSDKVTVIRGELEDIDILERAINEYEVDAIFHLAAQAIVGVANRNPLATFEANIKGTWNILEACRQTDCVKRIVVASSDKAYGDHEVLPYDETFALQGLHPYDVSKSCADLISLTYHNTYKLPVSITRCGNLFGPGDLNYSRIIPGTIRSIVDGQAPLIRSDGSPKRDYVYVKDIANAYLLLAEQMERSEICGQAYNFGTGEPLSVLELTEMILSEAGCDLKPDVRNDAKGEITHQYLCADKARKELNWELEQPLNVRIAETIEWYKKYLAQTSAQEAALVS